MTEFLKENWGSLLVLILIASALFLAINRIIKDKKEKYADVLNIRLSKGRRNEIKAFCTSNGVTVTQYIESSFEEDKSFITMLIEEINETVKAAISLASSLLVISLACFKPSSLLGFLSFCLFFINKILELIFISSRHIICATCPCIWLIFLKMILYIMVIFYL